MALLFHNASDDLAEALTAGRERLYLRHFYDRHAFDPAAIGPADLDRYTEAFSAAGAMRAGFELYRRLRPRRGPRTACARARRSTPDADPGDGGRGQHQLRHRREMLAEVAENVTTVGIPRCGHWVAEENPTAFVEELLHFVDGT